MKDSFEYISIRGRSLCGIELKAHVLQHIDLGMSDTGLNPSLVNNMWDERNFSGLRKWW